MAKNNLTNGRNKPYSRREFLKSYKEYMKLLGAPKDMLTREHLAGLSDNYLYDKYYQVGMFSPELEKERDEALDKFISMSPIRQKIENFRLSIIIWVQRVFTKKK